MFDLLKERNIYYFLKSRNNSKQFTSFNIELSFEVQLSPQKHVKNLQREREIERERSYLWSDSKNRKFFRSDSTFLTSSWLYLGKTLIFGKKSSSNQGKSTLLWNHFRLCLATYVTEILKGPKGSLWTPPGWLTATRNPSCKDCNVTTPQCPNSLNDKKTQTSMGGRSFYIKNKLKSENLFNDEKSW